MEKLDQSESIISLGRKLAEALDKDTSRDTLSCWISHYVAELIIEAETATGSKKRAVQKDCFEAILTLWQRRFEWPSNSRPFRDLESVIRTIESLDPEDQTHRYYRNMRPSRDEDVDEARRQWLRIADGLDYSAKLLIGYCLAEAAAGAINKSQTWVAMAEAAGIEPGVSEVVVQFLTEERHSKKKPDPYKTERDFLSDRSRRLKSFTALARQLALAFDERLKALPPAPE